MHRGGFATNEATQFIFILNKCVVSIYRFCCIIAWSVCSRNLCSPTRTPGLQNSRTPSSWPCVSPRLFVSQQECSVLAFGTKGILCPLSMHLVTTSLLCPDSIAPQESSNLTLWQPRDPLSYTRKQSSSSLLLPQHCTNPSASFVTVPVKDHQDSIPR